ncbi:hypothetical protein Tco_1204988 [Tanacetum coccineum]
MPRPSKPHHDWEPTTAEPPTTEPLTTPPRSAAIAALYQNQPESNKRNELELKDITSRVYYGNDVQSSDDAEMTFRKGSLIVQCGGHTALDVMWFIWHHIKEYTGLLLICKKGLSSMIVDPAVTPLCELRDCNAEDDGE